MFELGCDEAVPRLFAHHRGASLRYGAHRPLHRLGMDRIRRRHYQWRLYDGLELGVAQVLQQRGLGDSLCGPVDQI